MRVAKHLELSQLQDEKKRTEVEQLTHLLNLLGLHCLSRQGAKVERREHRTIFPGKRTQLAVAGLG